MSVLYTLMVAQQHVQPLEDSFKANVAIALFVAAGIFFLIFGLWFTRPKKVQHDVTEKSRHISFEWAPEAYGHLRHKNGRSRNHPSYRHRPRDMTGKGSDNTNE